jgi:hypothetical protein
MSGSCCNCNPWPTPGGDELEEAIEDGEFERGLLQQQLCSTQTKRIEGGTTNRKIIT